MSDNDDQSSQPDGGSTIATGDIPPPEVIEFDDRLLEAWFSKAPGEALNISLPRISLDMLFDGIHRGLQTQLDIVGILQDLSMGKSYDVVAFNQKAVPNIVTAMNSLRRFQMIAMSLSTGLILDGDLKVVEGEAQNGD